MEKFSKYHVINTILFLLSVTSCTNIRNNDTTSYKNSQKSNEIASDFTSDFNRIPIESGNEILGGWLKESIDQYIIIDKLGLPEKKSDEEYWGATGTYVQEWEYSSSGITLEMESENQNGIRKVRSIIIYQPCKLTTSRGIGIGANEKTVREKYLSFINESNSDTTSIVIGSLHGGTIFTFKNGLLNKIFIGAIAE